MKNNNPHIGHRKRLRNQVLQSGIDSLHEHQVLEYLLTFVLPQKDTNVIAHDLINHCGGFSKVFEADINELTKVNGVGEVVAHFLYNFKDFFYYYQKSKTKVKPQIHNPADAKNYMLSYFSNKTREEVYLIGIDDKNRVVETKLLSKGSSHQAPIVLQELTRAMLKSDCNSFILTHNHPFGKSNPSAEDDRLTRVVYANSLMNGFKMLDHIIVGENDLYSYRSDSEKWERIQKAAELLLTEPIKSLNKPFAKYEVE